MRRPFTAVVDVAGPFQVVSRPLTLRPQGTRTSAPAPVAWWKLDETGGAEAADASGQKHSLHVQGVAQWTPGKGQAGGAIMLDGPMNHLDAGDAPDFDFRDGMTVSMWVKPDGQSKSIQTLASKGSDTWSLVIDPKDGRVRFAVDGPQTTGKDRRKAPTATAKQALNGASWNHLAGVYDGQRIALYVNGELQESVAATGFVACNTERLWLGNNSGAQGTPYAGGLDDVRLFARGLTEAEVKALHRGGGR